MATCGRRALARGKESLIVKPHRRRGQRAYEVDVRWRGYPRLRLDCGTTNKTRAAAMCRTLVALRDAGRRDLLGLLAEHRLTLTEVHDAYVADPAALEQLKAKVESPRLGDLVSEWLTWCRSPAGISPRTKRQYASHAVQRYAVSWEGFFAGLPHGRDAHLSDITRGFVLDYRRVRVRATGGRQRKAKPGRPISAATFNRDMAALGAFFTWLEDLKGLRAERPRLPHEQEPRGRERWLSAEELRAFQEACPPDWWPFFATLFYTGARLGEVQGLRGADVLLSARRITIHEADRRVKSNASLRDLPIPRMLETALAAHLVRFGPGPADVAFPGAFQSYEAVRRVWDATCEEAEIFGATPHDARHTFAVHAMMAAVPLPRLQKLLGHSTPIMTLRYMRHAPEAFLDEDAEAVEAHLSGATDRERAMRASAARAGLRRT
jgi:integrase